MKFSASAFPGLIEERLPGGGVRYRVRQKGRPSRRTTISVGPGHYDFLRQYHDARAGLSTRADSIARLGETGNVNWHVREMLAGAGHRSKKKRMAMMLSEDDIVDLLLLQECRCAISRIRFDLRRPRDGGRRAFAPSIDRIDSTGPYIRENVMLTCTIVNVGRGDWPIQDFTRMCAEVAKQSQ